MVKTMKKEKSLVDLRRKKIIDFMKIKKRVTVEELVGKLDVSPITIRRDLQYLEDENFVVRFYGGAYILEKELSEEDEVNFYRRKIAEFAASLIEENDSIFINTSTTAIETLNYIKAKNITVITNNGRVIGKEYESNINILLTGGELRGEKMSLTGDFSLQNLEKTYPKKSFMGCSGLSPISGMTTENSAEMKINKQAIENTTEKVYILADHTKIGKSSSFTSAKIENIDYLITDEKADKKILNDMMSIGLKVYIVKKDSGRGVLYEKSI